MLIFFVVPLQKFNVTKTYTAVKLKMSLLDYSSAFFTLIWSYALGIFHKVTPPHTTWYTRSAGRTWEHNISYQ